MRDCICPPQAVSRYQRRISGPLLDRVDLFVEVPRVDYEKLAAAPAGERSAAVAARVEAAREVQHQRFAGRGAGSRLNAEMTPVEVRAYAQEQLADGAGDLLHLAVRQLNLSARAFHRVLKLARTIADLAHSDRIETAHVAESIQYRERVE